MKKKQPSPGETLPAQIFVIHLFYSTTKESLFFSLKKLLKVIYFELI